MYKNTMKIMLFIGYVYILAIWMPVCSLSLNTHWKAALD